MPTGDVTMLARAINGIVAPAIMISASALMILALHAKYSHLTDRLRALNEEKRGLSAQGDDTMRLATVSCQIGLILERTRLVRNSIMSLYVAIALFILSSLVIGAGLTFDIGVPIVPSLIVFMVGMTSVLVGTVYAIRDIGMAFGVAQIEVCGVGELENSDDSENGITPED
jgi:hypothetical protein